MSLGGLMANYEKTDQPGIMLDRDTGQLINTNIGQYDQIKAARAAKRQQQDLLDRVAALEQAVRELKAKLGE